VWAVRRERLGALVLKEGSLPEPDPELVTNALLKGIGKTGVAALPWSESAAGLRRRIAFLRTVQPGWPDLSDAALEAELAAWLGPYLSGVRRWDDLRRVDWSEVLLSGLSRDRRLALDRLAPTHVTVPSGSRLPLDYGDPAVPVLAVRLQEMFGQAETPTLADGAVAITLHLLSPAGRPVQVTRDLAGFWRTSYFEVRRDLRGRYPTPLAGRSTRGCPDPAGQTPEIAGNRGSGGSVKSEPGSGWGGVGCNVSAGPIISAPTAGRMAAARERLPKLFSDSSLPGGR